MQPYDYENDSSNGLNHLTIEKDTNSANLWSLSDINQCNSSNISNIPDIPNISNLCFTSAITDDSKLSDGCNNCEEPEKTASKPPHAKKEDILSLKEKICDEIGSLRYELYGNLTIEMNTLRHALALWNDNGLHLILTNFLSFNKMACNEIEYLNQRLDSIAQIVIRFVNIYKRNIPHSHMRTQHNCNQNQSNQTKVLCIVFTCKYIVCSTYNSLLTCFKLTHMFFNFLVWVLYTFLG